MEIISIHTYRDGGTRIIETSEGFFCIHSPLAHKPGIFYSQEPDFFQGGGDLVTDIEVLTTLFKSLATGCEVYLHIKRTLL